MLQGAIPSRVVLFTSVSSSAGGKWTVGDLGQFTSREVLPCFPADADSKAMQETGRLWAERCRGYDDKAKRGKPPVVEVTVDNKPFAVNIVGYDEREDNGWAYKVIDPEGRCFDMRRDVYLEAVLSCGVEKSGRLGGQFVFARITSQVRLVRVGSQLHTALTELTRRKAVNKVSKKDLVAGTIYANRKGVRFLFVGTAHTVEHALAFADEFEADKFLRPVYHVVPKGIERSIVRNRLVVLPLKDIFGSPLPDGAKHLAESLREAPHHFELQQSLDVIEVAGTVQLPADILKRIRAAAVKEVEKRIARSRDTHDEVSLRLACATSLSVLANLCPVEETPADQQEFQPYLPKLEQDLETLRRRPVPERRTWI